MIGRYKMKSGGLLSEARRGFREWREGNLGLVATLKRSDAFAEMRQGLDMVRRGKLRVLPKKIRGLDSLKEAFNDARRPR
jgi:hypothetical protein